MTAARLAVLMGLAAGCAGGPGDAPPAVPAPRDATSLGLKTASTGVAWRGLTALAAARITLPVRADEAPVSGTFRLDQGWSTEDQAFGRLKVFAHPLPFVTDMPRPNYAPLGARLMRGGTEIPYVNDPEDLRGGGWFIEHGVVKLLALEHPERWKEPPRLDVPEIAAAAARRRWSGVGDPAEFVRTEVTSAGVTRPGLQLPPGAEIAWSVDVPANTTLEYGVAQLPALVVGEGGGTATIECRVDGEVLATGSAAAGAPPKDEARALATWAGKRVEIVFRAPEDNGVSVVVTAPTITAPSAAPRRVVMVGIDTLRQDALGLYGYDRPTSPELDAWAAQSVVFDAAWAPAPRTRPSFRTALTGRYPIAAAAAPTIAEALSAQGFRTAGVVANVHLVPRFGFNDGFEHWHYQNGAAGELQVDRALAWLRAHPDEDTFLFLHLMDPHTFYDAPAPYGSKFQAGDRPKRVPEVFDRWHIYKLMAEPWFDQAHRDWIRAAYDGEVAYTSAMLGRFLAGVEDLPGNTLTVVHSDHGEEFWDHDAYEHNHTLYEELVRAVLWIRAPGGQSGSPRVTAPVGLVDIVPTILDLLGARTVPTDGRSLAAYVDPERVSERGELTTSLAERPLMIGHLMFGKERWAVVTQGWKYILHSASGEEELYDLAADRAEKVNLAATAPPERLEAARRAMAEASGWPVRPGWRLRIDGPGRPMVMEFEGPVAAAGVLDPEAERSARANLEWGERALVTSDEVGRVTLSEDRRLVRFAAGPRASGHQLWVTCDGPCPAGVLRAGDDDAPLMEGAIALGATRLEAHAGTVIEVPLTVESLAAPESSEMQALEALGYVDPH